MKCCFLFFVDAVSNHNKYYRMTENGDGTFTAEYGRVGASPQMKKYPMSSWDNIYQQKIRKGYTDQTKLHEVKYTQTGGYKPLEDADIADVVRKLQEFAGTVIRANYTVKANEVSTAMIEEAQDIIYDMDQNKDEMSVGTFNSLLLKLYYTIPRAMRDVKDFMADTEKDFNEILLREQNVLDVMAGQVGQYRAINSRKKEKNPATCDATKDETILEALGLDFRTCNDTEVTQIKRFLTSESDWRFRRAWRVHNRETDAKFDEYMAKHHLRKRDIHFYYHGSRNQNWWSIIGNGLNCNPKAIISGKMFGYGLYFANRAKKSIRYTGAGDIGRSADKVAYLAVFKVAYKNPLEVYQWEPYYKGFTKDDIRARGCDALFAHKGADLINDEIIVYDEAQTTIQYLIEIAA